MLFVPVHAPAVQRRNFFDRQFGTDDISNKTLEYQSLYKLKCKNQEHRCNRR